VKLRADKISLATISNNNCGLCLISFLVCAGASNMEDKAHYQNVIQLGERSSTPAAKSILFALVVLLARGLGYPCHPAGMGRVGVF
jgi:hypothetical protein